MVEVGDGKVRTVRKALLELGLRIVREAAVGYKEANIKTMKISLFYPVKPKSVNQPFGNPDPKYAALGLVAHNGIDLAAYHGQPVYAAHAGTAYYQTDDKGGHGVVIRTNIPFDYGAGQAFFKSIYWHLCDSSKEPQFRSPVEGNSGMQVRLGQLIGYADNTGLSTGDHLHFGLKPQGVGEQDGAWYNVEQTNGYLGAIDPSPYWNGYFAEDGNLVIRTLQLLIASMEKLAAALARRGN